MFEYTASRDVDGLNGAQWIEAAKRWEAKAAQEGDALTESGETYMELAHACRVNAEQCRPAAY